MKNASMEIKTDEVSEGGAVSSFPFHKSDPMGIYRDVIKRVGRLENLSCMYKNVKGIGRERKGRVRERLLVG